MRATVAALYGFIIDLVGIGFGPSVTAALSEALLPCGDGISYPMAIVAPAGYAIGAALVFVAVAAWARSTAEM